jgi:hypothetical protein
MKTQNIASRLDPQNNTEKFASDQIIVGDLSATQVDQTRDLLFTKLPRYYPSFSIRPLLS